MLYRVLFKLYGSEIDRFGRALGALSKDPDRLGFFSQTQVVYSHSENGFTNQGATLPSDRVTGRSSMTNMHGAMICLADGSMLVGAVQQRDALDVHKTSSIRGWGSRRSL